MSMDTFPLVEQFDFRAMSNKLAMFYAFNPMPNEAAIMKPRFEPVDLLPEQMRDLADGFRCAAARLTWHKRKRASKHLATIRSRHVRR